MEEGIHWSQSGVAHSKGSGSAMRSAPIGYFYQNDPDKLVQVARASRLCTHGHPTADAACIGTAYLVKLTLDGLPPENMIPRLLTYTEGIKILFQAQNKTVSSPTKRTRPAKLVRGLPAKLNAVALQVFK